MKGFPGSKEIHLFEETHKPKGFPFEGKHGTR